MKRYFALFFLSAVLLCLPVDIDMVMSVAGTHIDIHREYLLNSSDIQFHSFTVDEIIPIYEDSGLLAYLVELEPVGYVIISTDTDIEPVIAYSFRTQFVLDETDFNLPLYFLKTDMQNRLSKKDEIDQSYNLDMNRKWEAYLEASSWLFDIFSDMTVYGPLLSTAWDQGTPYNTYCPIDPVTSSRSLTGCVATAMAQIINYFQWPPSVHFTEADNFETYTRGIEVDATTASMDTINYNYGRIEMDEIARLSFACGVSVEMDYSSAASGASAASTHFTGKWNYYHASDVYPTDINFYRDLSGNIIMDKPAYMAIRSCSMGGHAIVVDGYNSSTNFYHLNYGWGGSSDGWYDIPHAMYGFNTIDHAIVGFIREFFADTTYFTGCAVNISAGSDHNIALGADATVWAWGNNSAGQLGNGTTDEYRNPARVMGLESEIIALSANWTQNIALTIDGTAYAWGSNSFGQLGDGTTENRPIPVQVLNSEGSDILRNIIAVEAGGGHSLAITADGYLWSWGSNTNGQLGDRTTDNRNLPFQVYGEGGSGVLSNVVQVAGGSTHSVALTEDGQVYTWGRNSYGQLGDGSTVTRRTSPVKVVGAGGSGFLDNIVKIASRNHHILAIDTDGNLWAWGRNNAGQLGNADTLDASTPIRVRGEGGSGYLSNIVDIACGMSHSVALADDGTVWAWGSNTFGQLGNGSNDNQPYPVKVLGRHGEGYLDDIIEIAAGLGHTTALKADSTVWGFGRNSSYQLGTALAHDSETPVQSAVGCYPELIWEREILLPDVKQIQAYPNPFNSSVSFVFPENVVIAGIYSTAGKLITMLEVENSAASWQASDNLPSGVYIVKAKLNSGAVVQTRAVYIK